MREMLKELGFIFSDTFKLIFLFIILPFSVLLILSGLLNVLGIDYFYLSIIVACLIILIFCVRMMVKIIRNPNLSKSQKWDRLFGKY